MRLRREDDPLTMADHLYLQTHVSAGIDGVRRIYIISFILCSVWFVILNVLVGYNIVNPSSLRQYESWWMFTLSRAAAIFVVLVIPAYSVYRGWQWLRFTNGFSLLLTAALLALCCVNLYLHGWFGQPQQQIAWPAFLRRIPWLAFHPGSLDLRDNWAAYALLSSLLCSAILVIAFKYDQRFDRTFSLEYGWRFPKISKTVAIIKQAISFFIVSCLLALITLSVWNFLANRTGWHALANAPNDLRLWRMPKNHPFWMLTNAWLIIIALVNIVRSLKTPLYDIFISYKSEQAETAREIADQLIANGRKVWFAEYEILLSNRDDELVQAAIDEGIRQSAYGLAITNNLYAGSKYCRLEMKQLLERCGPSKILEIRLPEEEEPYRLFPKLQESPSHSSEHTNEILDFVRAQSRWPIRPMVSEDEPPYQYYEDTFMGHPFRLNTTGWEMHERGGERLPGDNVQGPKFRCKHNGRKIFVNIIWGPEYSAAGQRRHQTNDDREMYNQLLKDYLPKHLGRIAGKVRGVHLLFHSGFSQMVLTYRMHGYWSRKASIILPHPEPNKAAEFVFTFGFKGAFTEYCRYSHLMDRFVESLEWR
ncbi:MAG: toll/interleukin-1 receptor domain-containing protein [Acidobacteriota bacterium]|nr:toll/interleukin-1 receptor domain-containing protein [Acidobacteriota bacterium]